MLPIACDGDFCCFFRIFNICIGCGYIALLRVFSLHVRVLRALICSYARRPGGEMYKALRSRETAGHPTVRATVYIKRRANNKCTRSPYVIFGLGFSSDLGRSRPIANSTNPLVIKCDTVAPAATPATAYLYQQAIPFLLNFLLPVFALKS